MIVLNEFLDYDMRLVNLRDSYLIRVSQFLTEARTPQQQNPQADSAWYLKWKGETALTLKNSFAKFKAYGLRQIDKYGQWLKDNNSYFDPQKYPPDKGCSISDAPNYRNAIMRIKEPLSNVISGVSLDNIQVDESEDGGNGQTGNNKWFMKLLIKSYNGTGDDFERFAKAYYYGEDDKNTIDYKEMAKYIPLMYDYCINYKQIIQSLETQLQSIIMFLNQDPISKVQNTSDNAEKELDALNQSQQQNQMASTNPQNNVVHASVDYLAFRETYMILDEVGTVSQAGQVMNSNMSKQVNTAPAVGANNTQVNQKEQRQEQKTFIQKQKNVKQLAMKKKQTAVNLVKACFACKTTAAGLIYRDFITTLQVYLDGVQQNIQKNNKKNKKVSQNG